MNSAVVVGRSGQDPEMKYFETGKVKTSFSIAVNRWTKNGDVTDWFNIELWDKQAEVAGNWVKKGSLVGVEGSISISKWTDKSGETKERYFIRGRELRLMGSKQDNQQR